MSDIGINDDCSCRRHLPALVAQIRQRESRQQLGPRRVLKRL